MNKYKKNEIFVFLNLQHIQVYVLNTIYKKKHIQSLFLLHLFGSLNLQISKTIMFGASSSQAFFNVYFITNCYYILLRQSSMINYNQIMQNHS